MPGFGSHVASPSSSNSVYLVSYLLDWSVILLITQVVG